MIIGEKIPEGSIVCVVDHRPAGWRSHGPVLSFGLRFGFLLALFQGCALTPWYERGLAAYLEANAWCSGVLLNLLGHDCDVAGTTIRSARVALNVRKGCDAIEPSWYFCAAVLSFPAAASRKLVGLISGPAVLQALNLVRIVSLYLIGVNWPRGFRAIHAEVWPVVFLVAALTLWIQWVRWTRTDDEPAR